VLLKLRTRVPTVFAAGDYQACTVTGPRADEVVAYVRHDDRQCVLTAVQRFPARARRNGDWRGTTLRVPKQAVGLTDVLTQRVAPGAELDPAELFATLPIAVLASLKANGGA
jgi:maltooligosyltrehalose synthase